MRRDGGSGGLGDSSGTWYRNGDNRSVWVVLGGGGTCRNEGWWKSVSDDDARIRTRLGGSGVP